MAKRSKQVFFILNLAFYWGGIPFLLGVAAVKLDRIIGISSIPAGVGLPLGAIFLGVGTLGAAWCAVAFYLRGGGFPIALCPPKRRVRAGPYGFSRHPLYLSFVAYFLGWGLIVRSPLAVAIASFIMLILSLYALFHEERVLIRRFGKEYEDYRREVPFFFRACRGVPGPGILFSLSYIFGKPLVRVFFPTKVAGKENLPQSGPAILIANHASYLDPIFVLAAADRYARFLTKAGAMRNGFTKWFFTRIGSIPTRRYRVDPTAVRGLLSALKAGEIVGIFPEGERTWDGVPFPIHPTVKRLLSRAGVPIVPARIEGSYELYPRWAKYPRPGPLKITFFPPVGADEVEEALSKIAMVNDGRAWLPRSARGIELVLWACPACHALGSIETHGKTVHCTRCGATWRIDRRLRLHVVGGDSVTLAALVSALPAAEILGGRETLTSIGEVDVLSGDKDLTLVASGVITYCNGSIQVGGRAFSLVGARILRLEGKDRLDIGFPGGVRLRLRFHRDSPLKWAQFLRIKLKIT